LSELISITDNSLNCNLEGNFKVWRGAIRSKDKYGIVYNKKNNIYIMSGFTINDFLDLLEMSDLDEDRKLFIKTNMLNLHKHYIDKFGEELIL